MNVVLLGIDLSGAGVTTLVQGERHDQLDYSLKSSAYLGMSGYPFDQISPY